MEKLKQELRFLLLVSPGFNSTLPYSKRNIDSNLTEILAVVQSSGVSTSHWIILIGISASKSPYESIHTIANQNNPIIQTNKT